MVRDYDVMLRNKSGPNLEILDLEHYDLNGPDSMQWDLEMAGSEDDPLRASHHTRVPLAEMQFSMNTAKV